VVFTWRMVPEVVQPFWAALQRGEFITGACMVVLSDSGSRAAAGPTFGPMPLGMKEPGQELPTDTDVSRAPDMAVPRTRPGRSRPVGKLAQAQDFRLEVGLRLLGIVVLRVLLEVAGVSPAMAQRLWLTTSTLWPSGSSTKAP